MAPVSQIAGAFFISAVNTVKKNILLASGLVLILWSVFAWPLPAVVHRGIPSSSQNIELNAQRSLIPGDHLQLYYSFWLVSQMVKGEIPWFQNSYEFNVGSDAARREWRHFYLPFSIPFSLLSFVIGPVIAWNLVGLGSLLLSYLFAFLVYRSFTDDPLVAHAAALVSIAIPYRWVNLLGGSPAGFAMLWPAAMAWAIDLTVRRRAWYGCLVGMILVFCRFTDVHVFFFAALATPMIFVICALNTLGRGGSVRRVLVRGALGSVLAGAVGSLALLYSWIRSHAVAASNLSGARELSEVALASPPATALLHWRGSGLVSHAYVGYAMLVVVLLLLTGIVMVAGRLRDNRRDRITALVVASFFLLFLVAAADLSLGVNGIGGETKWRWLCRLIPPYGQVRQPTKILCLFPLLGGAAVVALQRMMVLLSLRRRTQLCVIGVAALAVIVESSLQVRATITLLPASEPAYERVVAHARERGETARTVVVPLWPGDSAWTSLEQYAVTRHPTLLLNGYQPVVSRDYIDTVFMPLKSLNKGELTAAQNEHLHEMGVDYVVVRENAFPEKVSPFSVWHTLQAFARSPHLVPLTVSHGVWAYRRRGAVPAAAPEAGEQAPAWLDADWYGFSRVWSARHCLVQGTVTEEGVALAAVGDALATPSTSAGTFTSMRWVWLARGTGTVDLVSRVNGLPVGRTSVTLDGGSEWSWVEINAGAAARAEDRFDCRLELQSGRAEVKWALLADGQLMGDHCREAGHVVSIPALCFFHAGQGDPVDGSVLFQPAVDPDDAIWYGLRHPLMAGHYELLLDWEGLTPGDHDYGTLQCHVGLREDEVAHVDVAGHSPTRLEFTLDEADLVSLRFVYTRRATIRLRGIRLRKLPAPGGA